jgi:hypothetical protein
LPGTNTGIACRHVAGIFFLGAQNLSPFPVNLSPSPTVPCIRWLCL